MATHPHMPPWDTFRGRPARIHVGIPCECFFGGEWQHRNPDVSPHIQGIWFYNAAGSVLVLGIDTRPFHRSKTPTFEVSGKANFYTVTGLFEAAGGVALVDSRGDSLPDADVKVTAFLERSA